MLDVSLNIKEGLKLFLLFNDFLFQLNDGTLCNGS